MKKILFICRASVNDGLGHVMRCSTVISAFPKSCNVSLLVIGDEVAANVLNGAPFEYKIINDDQQIISFAKKVNPHLVVFDLINIDPNIFRAMQFYGPVVSISPIFNLQNMVDISYSRTRYESIPELNNSAKHRRSLKYATISKHCVRISEEKYLSSVQNDSLSVAICMGGSDAFNSTLKILEQVRGISIPLIFWVLVGEGYTHSYNELINCVKKDKIHEIIVAKTIRSMWRILSSCAIGIFAGGITTYEAAYAGLPSINTIVSDNQYFLLKELEEMGACFCIGSDPNLFGKHINRILLELDANRDELINMHCRSKLLIDGLGAYRITNELNLLLAGESID